MAYQFDKPGFRQAVFIAIALSITSTSTATDLRNVETVTPYSSNDIQIEGDVDMGSNNILSTGLVDGVDVDDPGNALTESSNSYAVASNSIYLDELNKGSVDTRYVLESGDTLSGDLDLNGSTISGIGGLNTCEGDEALLGDGSCGQAGNTAQRDLTTSNGLTGGQNNVLVGTDSDVDISISSGGVDTNEIASSSVTTTEISDGTITTDDFNTGDIDSSYLRRDGTNYMQGDLDLNDNNITDSAGGNITLSQDLKVYGKIWTPQTGEGGSSSATLKDILSNGNSAGNNNIDMDGNNIELAGGNVRSSTEICLGDGCPS